MPHRPHEGRDALLAVLRQSVHDEPTDAGGFTRRDVRGQQYLERATADIRNYGHDVDTDVGEVVLQRR